MTTSSIDDLATTAPLVAALVQRAGAGRVEVVRLLDEEVTVLDGPDAQHLAPRPWYDGLPAEQRETALAVALRGLTARGLARPSVLHETSGDVTIALPDDVTAVLSARRAASAIVMAQRQGSDSSSFRALYLQGDDVAVEEDVTPGGLHTFSVCPVGVALDALARFGDPDAVAGADGAVREVDLADVAAGEAEMGPMAESLWVTVMTSVLPGGDGEAVDRRISCYAAADRLEVAVPDPVRPIVLVGPVSTVTLRRRVGELLT